MNKFIVSMVLSLLVMFAVSEIPVSAEFVEKNGNTYYSDENGEYVHGLKKIDGSYYYFDKSGKMVKNSTVKVGDNIYKFGKNGKLSEKPSGLVKLGGTIYYCENGKINKDTLLRIGEDTYFYFDKQGKISVSDKRILAIDDEYILSTNADGQVYEFYSLICRYKKSEYNGITFDSLMFYTDGNKVYAEGSYTVTSKDVRYVSIAVNLKDEDGYIIKNDWLIAVDDNLSYGDKVRISDDITKSNVCDADVVKIRVHS